MFVKSRFSEVHWETKKTELTLQSQKRCVSGSGEIYTWELTIDDSLLVGRSVVLFFGSEKVNWEISQTWETWNSGPCFWRVSLLRETWNSGPCVCRVSLLQNLDYFIWDKDIKKVNWEIPLRWETWNSGPCFGSCVLTKENKRIALRNSNTKTVYQRFMENTWTTTWSLNSVFKRSGVYLVTTMTSLMKKTVS